MKIGFLLVNSYSRRFYLIIYSLIFTVSLNSAKCQVQLSDSVKGSISLNLSLAIPIGFYSITETDYSNFYMNNDNNSNTTSFNQKGGYADGGGVASVTYQNYQIHKNVLIGINSGIMLNGTYSIQDPPRQNFNYGKVDFINTKYSSNPWVIPYTVGQIGYRIKSSNLAFHFLALLGGCFISPSKFSSYFEVQNPYSSYGNDNYKITTSYSNVISGLYGAEIGLKYRFGKISLDFALTYLTTSNQLFKIKKEVEANVTNYLGHGASKHSNYNYTITDSKEFMVGNIMLSIGLSYYLINQK